MKLCSLIQNSVSALTKVKFLGRSRKLSRLDFGMLEVAMMVAALDGEVTECELAAFDELARNCRGYSEDAAAAAKSVALRSAGYLTLLAKSAPRQRLLDDFVGEALDAMPGGFINGGLEDVRRAFVMWVSMAIGDGEYSDIEREAIQLLKKNWCEIKAESLRSASSAASFGGVSLHGTVPVRSSSAKIALVADDFLDRVEDALVSFDERKVLELIKEG